MKKNKLLCTTIAGILAISMTGCTLFEDEEDPTTSSDIPNVENIDVSVETVDVPPELLETATENKDGSDTNSVNTDEGESNSDSANTEAETTKEYIATTKSSDLDNLTDKTADDTPSAEIAGSYKTFDELAADPNVLSLATKAIPIEESNINDYTQKIANATELYLNAAASDNKFAAEIAVNKSNMFMRTNDGENDSTIILSNTGMYVLDNTQKTGYYSTLPEGASEFNSQEAISEAAGVDITEEINNNQDIMNCSVEVDGIIYTLEIFKEGEGFLFNEGKLAAIITTDPIYGNVAVIVKEISNNIPDGIFSIPSDYSIANFDQIYDAFGGLESGLTTDE